MSKRCHTYRVHVRVAWWVRPYLIILTVLCDAFDCVPDMDKVDRTVRRGMKLRFDQVKD
jgi:hypothetical protein